jgi:histidine triad (HIT) family protein
MTESCIFCKIVDGKIPSARIHEDQDLIVIKDINPQAKVHWLVIPKVHVAHLDELSKTPEGLTVMGKVLERAARLAREHGLMPAGYRVVFNTNPAGGQTVYHLHAHVLGGENLAGSFGA